MRHFAGCCRSIWNKTPTLKKEAYETTDKHLDHYTPVWQLEGWKKGEGTYFLAGVHPQESQQILKDLDKAYKHLFTRRTELPRFKKSAYITKNTIGIDKGWPVL